MNHKRLAGAAVAALVGLGLFGAATPATAAPDDAAQITINGETINGHTYVAYKLATYANVQQSDGTVTGFDLVTDPAAMAAVKGLVATRDAGYADVQATIDPLQWVAAQNWTSDGATDKTLAWNDATSAGTTVRGLADDLAKAVTRGLVLTAAPEATAAADKVTLDVTEGLWLVVETTGSQTDSTTNSLPVIMGTPFMNGSVALDGGPTGQIVIKGDVVSIDKDIKNALAAGATNDTDAASGNEDEDWWTASTGDVVDFIIRTNVPEYPDSYVGPEFTVHDTWTDGLSAPILDDPATEGIDENSLVVKAGGEPISDFTYKVVGNTFTVALDNPTAHSGEAITVEYSATVLSGGTTVTQDRNKAYVEFTNNWWVADTSGEGGAGGPTTDTTETDEVDVYTFPLNVIKADLVKQTTYLSAEFTVYAADGTTLVGKITTNGATGGLVTDLVTSAAPKGLAGNAWYLVKETAQPAGYTAANLQVTKFWVYIAANAAEGELNAGQTAPAYYFADAQGTSAPSENSVSSVYVNPVVSTSDDANDADVLVLNAKSASDMPQTGGQILLWVTVAGVLGLGAAGFAVAGVRKSRTRSAHTA